MKIKPHDYQHTSISDIRKLFIAGIKSVLLQSSTGSGKTVIAAYMISVAAERGNTVYFIAHRDYLLSQTSDTLRAFGVPHGIISPAYNQTKDPVQVASVMTIIRRLDKLKPGDLLIVDEAHRSMAASHRKIIEAWPKARVVGLTATPQRLDGKPLGDVFQAIVNGPSMRWLIDNGYLCDFEIYAPPSPGLDTTGIRKIAGDYDQGEAAKRMNKPTITGSAVEHYLKLLKGKRVVIFCGSIKHSQDVAEQFNAAGIPAAHIDGTTPRHERQRIISEFEAGRILALTNVNLVVEGFDLPAVEGVILLRLTQSLVFFLQAVGRALRKAEGKTKAIILDHVGLVVHPDGTVNHGYPDEDRAWSLEGKQGSGRKKDEGLQIRIHQCKKCFYVYETGPEACPSCGEITPIKIRKIEMRDGELTKLSREAIMRAKVDRKKQQGMAKTYEDLIKIGIARGFKNPQKWAYFVHSNRKKKTS